jgi:3-dehydrosphinganine reductase
MCQAVVKSECQQVHWHSVDVTDKEAVQAAILAAEKAMGGKPVEMVFACAGAALPGLFTEQPLHEYEYGMQLNYLGAVYTLRSAVDRMVLHGVKNGRLVLVSSTAGLMGLPGYSQYAPCKFALRGLAECLRQELLPYGIKTHIYFVSTIASEGYQAENTRKPAITRLLEDGEASDPSPASRAKTLLNGIRKGRFMISSDMITDIIRVSSLGISPANFWPKDLILLVAGWLFLPLWRWWADRQVLSFASKTK